VGVIACFILQRFAFSLFFRRGDGGGGGKNSVNQGACVRPLQMFRHAWMEAMGWADQSRTGDHGKSERKKPQNCERASWGLI